VKKLFVTVILILTVSSSSFSDVRELRSADKLKYNTFKKLTIPFGSTGSELKDGFKELTKSGLCKNSNDFEKLRFIFDQNQWSGTVMCDNKGNRYTSHLRLYTDSLANAHCKKYERDALFAGEVIIKSNVGTKLFNLVFDIATIGLVSGKHVSASYYCSLNKNPNLIKKESIPEILTKPPRSLPTKPVGSTNLFWGLSAFLFIAIFGISLFIFDKEKSNKIVAKKKPKLDMEILNKLSDKKKEQVKRSKLNEDIAIELSKIRQKASIDLSLKKDKVANAPINIETKVRQKDSIDLSPMYDKTTTSPLNNEEVKLHKLHSEGILTDEELIKALSKVKK